MNRIKQKLRSNAGVSMILAMVFMLFCSFIGCSVLASATANAQRVAQVAEQQDFLLERSAALLLSDQLQLDDDSYLRLYVTDSDQTIQEMKKINDGGAFEPTDPARSAKARVIRFQVQTDLPYVNMTQRLALECAVLRYLRQCAVDSPLSATVTVSGLLIPASGNTTQEITFDQFITDISGAATVNGLLMIETSATDKIGGTIDISSSFNNLKDGWEIPDLSGNANYSCGKDTTLYDFFVDFGEDTQVKMTMNGYSGSGSPITVTHPTTEGSVPGLESNTTGYIQITEAITQTTISWEDPMIEKGGAD